MATTDPTSLTSASASAAAPTATLAPAPQSAPTSSPASASVPELPVHPVQIPVQTSTYTPFNHVSTADDLDTTLSSDLQPLTNATLTIRCIKSFEYRTEKNLVLKGLDLLTMTVGELMERCREGEWGRRGWMSIPFRFLFFLSFLVRLCFVHLSSCLSPFRGSCGPEHQLDPECGTTEIRQRVNESRRESTLRTNKGGLNEKRLPCSQCSQCSQCSVG